MRLVKKRLVRQNGDIISSDESGSLFIGSVTLIHEIWTVTDWDKTLRYKIVAKYNETSNVAIFEMKNAVASEIQKHTHGRTPKLPK